MTPPEEKIEVSCPKCGNRLRFSTKFLGRSGLCPLCGASFKIAPPPKPEAKGPNEKDPEGWKISTYFKNPQRKKEKE